jgi:hypothetical protein
MEIIVQKEPQRRKPGREEARLQAKCVTEFAAKYPHLRDHLIGTFQETRSRIEGSLKQGLGLVRGVSDLIYFPSKEISVGIEMKIPGSNHNVKHIIEQCMWLRSVPTAGWFCDSVECFWNIIENGYGIDPDRVLRYVSCNSIKTLAWNSDLFKRNLDM